jgi:drug/metabolite transporter (DMT)-like permease
VRCPGELQTILNQMVIPITMVGAAFFLRSRFQSFQIWGSVFIICGALIASSDYLFGGASDDAADDDDADFHHHELKDVSPRYGVSAAYGTDSGVTAAMTSAAVVVYLLSVVPSAFSNIYKESKMKDADMDEFHTSTAVSFYQLVIGFFFLPLMAIPALGKSIMFVCMCV